MATDARARHGLTGYAAEPVTKAPPWHGLVACDLLFNNLTTGLFLIQALGELAAPDAFRPLSTTAYSSALALLVADLLCLVLDLGDALRFHHMLRVFKPTSPMSLGTWCLTIYSVPLAAAVALSLAGEWPRLEWIRKAILIVGLVPALGTALYKGVLLSATAQPGWRDARWLGGYLANSALMLGCAELLALSILLGQEKATTVLRPALVLLLMLNALFFLCLLAELSMPLRYTFTPPELWYFMLVTVGAGMVAPLGLLLLPESSIAMLAAVLLLVLGSLAIRFAIVRIPRGLR